MSGSAPEYVSLVVTTSNDEYNNSTEKRFSKSETVSQLKGRLELLTGGSANNMTLELRDKEDALVTKLDDDDAPLGSYPVDNGMRLHVVDNFELRKEYETSSKSEKYQMSAEKYDKRSDSVRSFLKNHKLGKYNEAEMAAREESRKEEAEREKELAKKFNVGDRCEVAVPEEPVRQGIIRYVGEVANAVGWWIGVQYDEPLGKHNEMIDGYFECPDKCGAMVKPIYVKTGSFPLIPPTVDEL